jgi:hypothetical protein
MDPSLRERLEHLAAELHLHREDPQVSQAHAEVTEALNGETHEGVAIRLERQAVALESSHPALGSLLRQAADAFSATGL